MKISDLIENFLKDMINETEDSVEIQRNELANYFKCVPSQINYVISTRFTAERGYIVESRRGGGGYIKIRRINISKSSYLMHIVNSIGDAITQQAADAFITNFRDYKVISENEAKIMRTAISDKVLQISPILKDRLRASILKHMVLSLV